MDLPAQLRVVHEPARLRILGLLARERRLRLADLARALDLTDGNAVAHVRRLEEAGFVELRRRLVRGVETQVVLTATGLDAFERYVALLRAYLESVQ